jgi:hypothetical protein
MPIKEECCLCGKVLPYYSLRRCVRCTRLYCSTCIEYTRSGDILCLNCARRVVSPRRLGTKYSPLSRYLAQRARFTDLVMLSFNQIGGIIGGSLSLAAFQSEDWWKGTSAGAHRQAWLAVGWHVESVDLEKRTVSFRREKGVLRVEKKQAKRKQGEKKIPKPLPRAKPRTSRVPSKTKMAKMVARLKNIERQKMVPKTLRGRFKSR